MHVSQCKPEKKRKTRINLFRTGDSRVWETRCKFIKEMQKTKKVRQQMEKVQKSSNPKKTSIRVQLHKTTFCTQSWSHPHSYSFAKIQSLVYSLNALKLNAALYQSISILSKAKTQKKINQRISKKVTSQKMKTKWKKQKRKTQNKKATVMEKN